MKKNTPEFKAILALLICIFSINNVFAEIGKTKSSTKVDYKKFVFGFTFKGKNPIWSQDLCKSLDYNSLKPTGCKKANDNIGNKSILCNLPDKKLKLAAYINIDDCKTDLQMSTEGDNP